MMKTEERTAFVLRNMGFGPEDTGPYCTKLRAEIRRQVEERGLVNRSAGTWAPEAGPAGLFLDNEERARAFLEVEWELENGHSVEVRCIDRPWGVTDTPARWSIRVDADTIRCIEDVSSGMSYGLRTWSVIWIADIANAHCVEESAEEIVRRINTP